MILTASILRIYVTWQGTNVTLPDDDRNVETCRSTHYIRRYRCDIRCAFAGCNKNKRCTLHALK